jgi:hypothetical protein
MQQPATSTNSYGKELMARGQSTIPLIPESLLRVESFIKKGSKYGEHVSDLERGWIGPCLALLPLKGVKFRLAFCANRSSERAR